MAKKKRQKKDKIFSPPEESNNYLWVSWKRFETSSFFCPILALVGLLMGLLFFDKNLSLSGDNAQFIDLGRALASGKGFSETLGDNPIPHTKYPFGFPLMLAIVETFFPFNITALKGLIILLYAISVPLTYKFIQQDASPFRNVHSTLALPVTSLCLISPPLLNFSHQIMSEIPFLTFSLMALILLERANSLQKKTTFVWAILVTMTAFYIRTTGIVLILTGIGFFTVNKKYTLAAIMAVSSILIAVPWFIRNAALGEAVYLNQILNVNPYNPEAGFLTISTFVERILSNLNIYGLTEIPRIFFPSLVTTHSFILGIGVSSFLIHSLISGFRRRELPAIYLILYLSLYLCWPQVWSDIRFLLPAIPIFFYVVLKNVSNFITWLNLKISILPPKLVFVLIFIFPLSSNIQAARQLSEQIGNYPANWENYFEASEWIKKNTGPKTRIACRKPFLMYVISNRKSSGYSWKPPDLLIEDLEKNRIDIVVLDQLGFASTPRYLAPAINKFRGRFKILHKILNPDTYILKFKKTE